MLGLDPRLAEVLRLVGEGKTCSAAAARVGLNRKTVQRWRTSIPGFGAAYDQAVQLSSKGEDGRDLLELLTRSWMLDAPDTLPTRAPSVNEALRMIQNSARSKPSSEPAATPSEEAPVTAERRSAAVEPDVLDAQGQEIAVQGERPEVAAPPSPYTTQRPPTRAEFNSMLAQLIMRDKTPERVRAVAIAALNSSLPDEPSRSRRLPEIEEPVVTTARAREQGVPASVWQEARRNFLGPAPEDAQSEDGQIVELDQAQG
jgi:hypothetical protein